MFINLTHLPITPILYGVVLAMQFFVLRWRFNRGDYGHILLSVMLLWMLFSMHGEHAETRMGAALAVLFIDGFLAIKTITSRS